MNSNLTKSVALSVLALAAFTASAEKDLITKTFPIKPGGKLMMNVDRGSIHVITSESDKVDIKITRELTRTTAAKAKEIFETHKIDLTSEDNQVKIETHVPRNHSGSNPFSSLQVDYTIAIPAKFDIDLHTAGGHIEVGDLEGDAEIATAGGNLKIGTIKGPLRARTAGGHISVEKVTGEASVDTSGGNVQVSAVDGNLVVHTSGGHIDLGDMKGSVKASTSGGHINVTEAEGTINARTSGGHVSAKLIKQPAEDCSLKTSGGNIDLRLAPKLAFNLDAQTGGGRVASDFPGDFNKAKTKLAARINGGGPEFVLQTSGGNINVTKE